MGCSLSQWRISARQKLQEKLCEMESELRSVRQASQQQERTIQGLRETAGTKDREVGGEVLPEGAGQWAWQTFSRWAPHWLAVMQALELHSVIEGQKEMLFRLREVTQRHQLQHLQVRPLSHTVFPGGL